jgi:chemotaxis protein MotB
MEQVGAELEREEPKEWLMTFADLSLLLLVFFILLFSMSTLDPVKFTDSFTSVKRALGEESKELMTARVKSEEAAILDSIKMQKQLIESQKKIFSDVKTFLNRKGVEGVVGAVFDEGKITLRIPGEALYPSGRVQLTDEGRKVIREVKDYLSKVPDQQINIRGFTDDVPPGRNSRFEDNWEISSLRAVNVLRYLMQLGIESERMTATGLADLEPLFPNNSPENRARNRRVELVLEKQVGK